MWPESDQCSRKKQQKLLIVKSQNDFSDLGNITFKIRPLGLLEKRPVSSLLGTRKKNTFLWTTVVPEAILPTN